MLDPKLAPQTRGVKHPLLLWGVDSWSPDSFFSLDEAVTVERRQIDEILGDIKVRGTTSWPLPPQLPSFLIKDVCGEGGRYWEVRSQRNKEASTTYLPLWIPGHQMNREHRERRKMQR